MDRFWHENHGVSPASSIGSVPLYDGANASEGKGIDNQMHGREVRRGARPEECKETLGMLGDGFMVETKTRRGFAAGGSPE
jgi:hypothetical protein